MKKIIFLITLGLSMNVFSQTIQVPDKCATKSTPCLIKTQNEEYKFVFHGYEVGVSSQTIIKISFDKKHINFTLLNGYLSLEKSKKNSVYTASVNTVLMDGHLIFTSQVDKIFKVLSLEHFMISEYSVEGGKDIFAARLKSEFVTKKDLVLYVKNYFTKVSDMRRFLSSVEDDWNAEFKSQNEIQTKAMMRSVASEESKVEKEAQQRRQSENELKKSKNLLFYRTFER